MNPQKMPWNLSPNASERTTILNEKLAKAHELVPITSRWLHKKGGRYVVGGYTIDTTTGNVLILYKRFGGPDYDLEAELNIFFSRPIEEWTLDRFTPLI